jgi:DNA-binding GntR family transcriptional regulator
MHPDQIASVLRRALRQRIFPPGQALNQDDLAKRFGVSRIPLREALRTLAAEGLIIMRPGVGAVVTELSPAEVEELYDIRLLLEPPLAPAIVRQARPRDIEELEGMVARMDLLGSAEGRDTWSTQNYAFHRHLHELSGRRHHVRLIIQVLNLVEPYSRIYAHVLSSVHSAQQEHHQMVQAVASRDAAHLALLLENSIQTTRDRLLAEALLADTSPDPLDILLDRGA